MAQVINLGSDAQKRQSAKQKKQFFQRCLPPSVALAIAEENVKLAVVACLQVKLVAGKYPQSIEIELR